MLTTEMVVEMVGVAFCLIGVILAGLAMSSREYEVSRVRLTLSSVGILMAIVGAVIGYVAFLTPFINQVTR